MAKIKEFEAMMKKLDELPPTALSLDVYSYGYHAIKNSSIVKNLEFKNPYEVIPRIELNVKAYMEGVNINEGRVNYSDGSYKIIKVFDVRKEM